MEFRDRRPGDHLPSEQDYQTPLTRTSLAEANRRFRQTGQQRVVGNDPEQAAKLIKRATKSRFNARRRGVGDLPTIGDYLEYLNGDEVS